MMLNAFMNPYGIKSLNKNFISGYSADDYAEAKKEMNGHGKDHYAGLSPKQRNKSIVGGRRTR